MEKIHRRVVVAVLGGHLFVCLYLAFGPESESIHTTKPLVVNTVVPKSAPPSQQKKEPPPKVVPPSPLPPTPTPPPPKQEAPQVQPLEKGPPPSTPTPKQQQKEPAIQEKRPTNKKQPAKPTAERERLQKELLRELEAIEGKNLKSRRSDAPRPLQLSIDRSYESAGESGYEEKLIAFLHGALHLPDLGAVRLQLTVRADGTLSKLLVIKAESEKNRKYLEENLPRLRFPPPSGGKERNLLMTFFNEVN